MKVKAWFMIAGILALVLVGCRTNPVYSVEGAPVTTSTRGYNLRDVRDAIQQAGISLGWQMRDVRPGLIIGTLTVREHMARWKFRITGPATASSTGIAKISITTASASIATTMAGFNA